MTIFKQTIVKLFVTLGFVAACHASTIEFSGLTHTSLGSASLNNVSGCLVVSGIGSTGEDGVSIALPNITTFFSVNLNDPGILSSSPVGSYIQFTSYGYYNNKNDQKVSSFKAANLGSQINYVTDFSSVTTSDLIAQYFQNGNLVALETIPPIASWYSNSWFFCGGDWEENGQGTIDFPPPEQKSINIISPNNNIFNDIDRIDIMTTSLDVSFAGYSSVAIVASGISTFTINEEVLIVPEPNSLSLMSLALIVYVRRFIAQKIANGI